jgi:integrase
VERDCALEDPPVGRHDHQSRQQPLERDQLAQPHQRDIALPSSRQESLFERRAEGGGGRISHAETFRSAPLTSAATRRPRFAAPCRSWSGVARPPHRRPSSGWTRSTIGSAATMLPARGLTLGDIQKVLGHSQISLTANLYTHAAPEISQRAAGTMDAIFGVR